VFIFSDGRTLITVKYIRVKPDKTARVPMQLSNIHRHLSWWWRRLR